MFSMQNILRQMTTCTAFANQLLGQLQGTIPALPAACAGTMACFRVPLCNEYSLSVAIPLDKNRTIEPTDTAGDITVETALFKGDKLAYDDELGYADVCSHDFDAQAILAEYTRLMALLAKRD